MSVPIKEKIKTIITLIKEKQALSAIISLRHSGYLVDQGWFSALKEKQPIDSNKDPIPWVTYPFIDFIRDKLKKSMTVFEFGAGNSTLFYAKYCKSVTAVEDDEAWVNKLQKKIPPNAKIIFEKNPKKFSATPVISNYIYDIVIIDGGDRNECIQNGIKALSDQGIVILDDSERVEYRTGIEYLRSQGFRSIDFWGISPGYLYKKCTSIYYKSQNCLEI